MKQLRRVFLEQSPGDAREAAGKDRFRSTPSAGPEKRKQILKNTLAVRQDRNARAAAGGQASSRPGYSSVDDSVIPLIANRVHIHEINIVNGKLTAGKGTKPKPVGPLTRLAIKKRDAGQATPASEKTLERAKTSDTNTAVRRPSKFNGPRVRTKAKKPVKPNTEPLPRGFQGGDAESTRSIQNQVASKQ